MLLKILSEQYGKEAAENCSKLKKADLALAMANRIAGKEWLPSVLEVESIEEEGDRKTA